MSTKFNWHCPFCQHKAVIHDGENGTLSSFEHAFFHDNRHGRQSLVGQVVVCPNSECKEYSITLALSDCKYNKGYGVWENLAPKRYWNLIPDSEAKIFPHFIPKPILDDYREACLIVGLSPKASATLSRRCLQGIIRDFWKVSKPRLVDEIESIKDKIDSETWEAIDSVRSIGNIGAHMEKDINIIIDVEPEEAQLLIGLIETLLTDWYVARHERQQRMVKIKAVAGVKDLLKGDKKAK